MKVIAVADPAEHWNLDAFYYGGDAGRKPPVEQTTAGWTRVVKQWDLFAFPRSGCVPSFLRGG